MARYEKNHILRSERAYQILKAVSDLEGATATKISDSLDINRSMTSEILGKLKELSVLEKEKEGRKRLFYLDMNGISSLFKELLADRTEETDNLGKVRAEVFCDISDMGEKQKQAIWQDEIPSLIELYAENYLLWVNNSTIEDMLIDDFFYGLRSLGEKRLQQIPYLRILREYGSDLFDWGEDPAKILDSTITQFLKE